MTTPAEGNGRKSRPNRGGQLQALLEIEKGQPLARTTSTRVLPSTVQSLPEEPVSTTNAGETQSMLHEKNSAASHPAGQPAPSSESLAPIQPTASMPASIPPAPPAAAPKQPVPSAPDPLPNQIPSPSKQPTVLDFCKECNPKMSGIPAQAMYLQCEQVWTEELNPALHLGIRLSSDVAYVAGDIVSITHKAKEKIKIGKMVVVCVEQRKDKLYLVGLPDKEQPPPPHTGPNFSSPYYSCPLFKAEWTITVIHHLELGDSVNQQLKAAILQYLSSQAKKGNEGSLIEVIEHHGPRLRASSRLKAHNELHANTAKPKTLQKKKKRRTTHTEQKLKEEQEGDEDEEQGVEEDEDEGHDEKDISEHASKAKYQKNKAKSKVITKASYTLATPPTLPAPPLPPLQAPPPGFYWVYMPTCSSWVLMQLTSQQQQQQQLLQQQQQQQQQPQQQPSVLGVQPAGLSAPVVTGVPRPSVNFAITNVFPT